MSGEIPFYPDENDPARLNAENKQSYDRGHDDGYRNALHDLQAWLDKIAESPAGYHARQYAAELRSGSWRAK